jgi:hypothetical protein
VTNCSAQERESGTRACGMRAPRRSLAAHLAQQLAEEVVGEGGGRVVVAPAAGVRVRASRGGWQGGVVSCWRGEVCSG